MKGPNWLSYLLFWSFMLFQRVKRRCCFRVSQLRRSKEFSSSLGQSVAWLNQILTSQNPSGAMTFWYCMPQKLRPTTSLSHRLQLISVQGSVQEATTHLMYVFFAFQFTYSWLLKSKSHVYGKREFVPRDHWLFPSLVLCWCFYLRISLHSEF